LQKLITLQLKVGVGPESESDNRNCPKSESNVVTSDTAAVDVSLSILQHIQ